MAGKGFYTAVGSRRFLSGAAGFGGLGAAGTASPWWVLAAVAVCGGFLFFAALYALNRHFGWSKALKRRRERKKMHKSAAEEERERLSVSLRASESAKEPPTAGRRAGLSEFGADQAAEIPDPPAEIPASASGSRPVSAGKRAPKNLKIWTRHARAAYKRRRRAGQNARTPVPAFTLSKADVYAYLETLQDGNVRRVDIEVEKGAGDCPDTVKAGVWPFVLLEEYGEALRLTVRLDEAGFRALKRRYPGFVPCQDLPGKDWYSVVADGVFGSKEEVYEVLSSAFCYMFYNNYSIYHRLPDTDWEAAKADASALAACLENKNGLPARDALIEAAARRKKALDTFIRRYPLGFDASAAALIRAFRLANPDAALRVFPAKDGLSPLVLKSGRYPFAKLTQNQNTTEIYARLSPRLEKKYLKSQPQLRRTAGEREADWFILPVSGAFSSIEAAALFLSEACGYVRALHDKPIKKRAGAKKKNASRD